MTHCIHCVHYRARRARMAALCARNGLRCDTSRAPGGDCYPIAKHFERAPLHFNPQPTEREKAKRGGFVDFLQLTLQQQAEAISVRPHWPVIEFHRFRFWVTPAGHVSRRNGHHALTAVEVAMIEAEVRAAGTARSKGDLGDYSSARFHLAPERSDTS